MTVRNDLWDHSDSELVELALRDDERACRALVERYREKVFGVVVGILKDFDHAESAWQETFIRVFRNLGRYQPDRAFGNWIAKIARRAALDKHAKYVQRIVRVEGWSAKGTEDLSDLEPLQVADRAPSPLEQVMLMERLEQVTFAMASLHPHQREALLLHLEGLPHAEIATRMGVPVNTVNTWIKRAKECIKRACPEISTPLPR